MRRAFTLVEMITAMTVGTVLMGIAVSLLVVLLGAEQSGRAHVARSESLRRLADQFRRDVHAAVGETAAKGAVPVSPTRKPGQSPEDWTEDRPECRLSLPDNRSVQYTIGADSISREERTDSKVVRRETYLLPKDSTAAVAVDRTTTPWTLSLTIVPSDASMRQGHEIRIDALLGRDRRFTQPQKEGK
jgi:prepilin-type N-terminal cleavage/methylation domain-containing protein